VKRAMSDLVLRTDDGGIAFLTLNRPDALNALSPNVFVELRAHIDSIASSLDTVGCVVLRGAGRSFCAGNDLKAIMAGERAPEPHFQAETLQAIEDLPQPVIASVQGHCLGGGCELMMLCDLAVAADDAVFGEPEIRFSNVGPGLVMPFVIGLRRARELLYLGDSIDAKTALSYGMVNRVVPRARLQEETMKLARRIALISPEALAATKLATRRGAEAAGFRNAILAGLDVLAPLYAARTEIGMKFDEIREKEGLGAALKWRAAQFAD